MGIRVTVVDDNPHVAWDGRVYPVNATFQHFVAALLDIPGSPVEAITSCVPLREADAAPAGLPLDPRIRVVRTAPFDGIAGYLRHLPSMLRANRPTLAHALTGADLVWLKVPASNAALAGAIAARAGVARFVWVAGSASDVAAGRFRGPTAVGALAVGAGYDLAGRMVGGAGVVDGDGVVASLVEPVELRDPDGRTWPADPGRTRLAWAGRLAGGKGLEALVAAVALDPRLTLDVLGDGPDRQRLRDLAEASGAVSGSVGRGTSPTGPPTWTAWPPPTRSSSPRPPRGSPRSSSTRSPSGCRSSPRAPARLPSSPMPTSCLRSVDPTPRRSSPRWTAAPRRPGAGRGTAATGARVRGEPHASGRGGPARGALAALVARPAVGALSA